MKPSRVSELVAGVLVVLLGGPLVFMFASASADGEVRRRETPLRALLGNEAFEALSRGQPSPVHYLGRNRRAPDFTLQDRQGRPWKLSEHRGKTILMNFWTVTCAPCIHEMPTLEHLARLLEGRDDIEMVTISTDRSWDTVRTVVSDSSPIPVLLDPDRAVTRGLFGTRLFPETWIIDPDGLIRLRVDGERDWASPVTMDALEVFSD